MYMYTYIYTIFTCIYVYTNIIFWYKLGVRVAKSPHDDSSIPYIIFCDENRFGCFS